jgi:2-succinyl-5-enolpyruvyl-6-hydroxy-3-cyclohexene-1-carboxylate synthase
VWNWKNFANFVLNMNDNKNGVENVASDGAVLTTDKVSCLTLLDLLIKHGIEDVFVSPGSRNAPLIMALNREPRLKSHIVIDERSAAFMALGLAAQLGRPVALVCTSGTAVLNYAPAVAEAFYRQVPLIVISADRPKEWIDQDDSQTIRQAGALSNIVKQSIDIPVDDDNENRRWMVGRLINDVLIKSVDEPKGPIHINMQFDEPLTRTAPASVSTKKIERISTDVTIPSSVVDSLAAEILRSKKVLIIGGFYQPSPGLNSALGCLAEFENIAVMHEAQSNISDRNYIANIDSVLSEMTDAEKKDLVPDIVITFGGSLVSRMVKSWLRTAPGLEHWHVGRRGHSVDCFKALTKRIETMPETFFEQLRWAMDMKLASAQSSYKSDFARLSGRAVIFRQKFVEGIDWSDMKAMAMLIESIPPKVNVQFSNGTAIRYVQLMNYGGLNRIECNRGVSGIDGSTSTAIGAHLGYDGVTILVTGDMSAQYDVGALAATCITPRFKMVVLNNSGGGIFRFIKSTSNLPELEKCFAADVRLPLKSLADGYGFSYYEVHDSESFQSTFNDFFNDDERPAILNMITPAEYSARVLKEFFDRKH